jgi:glutathione-independent formaldehyde dehydrogenase
MGTGQPPVQRQLRDVIIAGRATPEWIVSHEAPLSRAPAAYDKFDVGVDGHPKVVQHPVA